MIKQTIIATLFAVGAMGAYAQSTDMMYLIKGDHVVSKYKVDDVDYVSFELPAGVIDNPIWLSVDKVGKNTVTYTVSAVSQTETYAHGLVPFWEAQYASLDNFGDEYNNLSEAQQVQILQALLPYYGYLGIGTNTFTQTDSASDGVGSTFEVMPNNKYFLCAWQIDPVTEAPLDLFVYDEFTTVAPGVSQAAFEASFLRQNEQGIALKFTGSNEISYVQTCWGVKNVMESYKERYGMDMLMGMFGQRFTLSQLEGMSPEYTDVEIENATWPAFDSGEYIMYVRAYDVNGDMIETSVTATYEAPDADCPKITVWHRDKGEGFVEFNFEISPSNVDEAYVRLMKENDVDDMINDGWTLAELACSSQSADITSTINRLGEYTFTANDLTENWYAILVYAKNSDGSVVQRFNFWPDTESEWADYNPVTKPAHSNGIRVRNVKSNKPAIKKIR